MRHCHKRRCARILVRTSHPGTCRRTYLHANRVHSHMTRPSRCTAHVDHTCTCCCIQHRRCRWYILVKNNNIKQKGFPYHTQKNTNSLKTYVLISVALSLKAKVNLCKGHSLYLFFIHELFIYNTLFDKFKQIMKHNEHKVLRKLVISSECLER